MRAGLRQIAEEPGRGVQAKGGALRDIGKWVDLADDRNQMIEELESRLEEMREDMRCQRMRTAEPGDTIYRSDRKLSRANRELRSRPELLRHGRRRCLNQWNGARDGRLALDGLDTCESAKASDLFNRAAAIAEAGAPR